MKITVADYTIQFLVDQRVKDIFVLTGHGAMFLNDAIARNKKIASYFSRHETTAALMAEAYARLKGSLGAICVTAGPGAANVVPGLAEAFVDNAPILIISGQVPRRHTTQLANIPGLRSFGTAEINIIPVVTPMTKYAATVNDPNTIRFHLEKASYLAISGKPGPVWIEIPLDVQSSLIDPKTLKGFKIPKEKNNQSTLLSDIKKIIDLLNSSKKPLIVAGGGLRQSKSIEEFKKLAQKLKIPIILTRLGVDILPYSNPYNMGLGGIRGNKHSNLVMHHADTILVLGSRLSIPVVGYDLEVFNKDAKIAVIDIDPAELKKPGVKISLPLEYELSVFLKEFNKKLSGKKLPNWKDWLQECINLKKSYPMVTDDLKRNPIDLYYFMSRLDALADKKHLFTSDSGSNYYIAGQIYHFEKGQREISSIGFGAMGLTIPLAAGASIAAPDLQILAVTGDGSLELNIQDLKTISFFDLNIKLFVINNGGYVSMRNWQDTFFKGRRIGADEKSGVGMLNLKKVAAAFDMPYDIIDKYEKIDSKLKTIFKKRGPLLIEVVCRHDQTLQSPINEGPSNYAG